MTGAAEQEPHGVVFPAGPDGRRSTAAVGRAVIADALRPVDPPGALAAEQETNWRAGYITHVRRTVEAGLASRATALQIAGAGLDSLHARMRVAGPEGETSLSALRAAPATRRLDTVELRGHAEPERELSVPYRGQRLRVTICTAGWSPGSTRASSSPAAGTRCVRSPTTPSGWRCPGEPSPSWVPVRRWARSPHCCGGVRG